MNLYSNKQKWKIALLVVALLLVGASLFVSNSIVTKVGQQEQQRALQWADAIKKKVELVQLTNRTFSQLREREKEKMSMWVKATKEVSNSAFIDRVPEFPMQIVKGNTDIPVILLDQDDFISGHRNIGFDTTEIKLIYPDLTGRPLREKFDDSLRTLAKLWETKNPSFTVEVYEGLFMTYVYNDSKTILRLEAERDSLIQSFNRELIDNEDLVPVILLNSESREVVGSNISQEELAGNKKEVLIHQFAAQNDSITINLSGGDHNVLYFDDSPELKQLQYFPYIQFLIIGLFGVIGYLIFSTFRKAEQNQVWAGMAKETAHQLGTPLSSLMAWVQLLEAQDMDPMIVGEMSKDVKRLEKVTDRFSKIGSGAKLEDEHLTTTVTDVVNYLRPRISDKVVFELNANEELIAQHNGPLMEWVVENICKNAVDAMEGKGKLTVTLSSTPEWAHIDIKDTGKGIPTKQIKTIFEPGFTTKKRGWGLGLSLVKRIVKEYHKGKVFVAESKVGEGTTFRISIPLRPL